MAPTLSTSINVDTCITTVDIMEECRIAPPFLSPRAIPLTFLDIPWLQFPPVQPLFFFQIPSIAKANISTHSAYLEFNSTILPGLKHSLSSALEYFFPFVGKLSKYCRDSNPDSLAFETGNRLESSAVDDDIVLTVAFCDADMNDLCSYNPKSADIFQLLVPSLPVISLSELGSSITPVPLFAVQITFFPASPAGFAIGLASHPVLCDQRTLSNFLYSWAYFSKFGNGNGNGNGNRNGMNVNFERSAILAPTGLKPVLLKQTMSLMINQPRPAPSGLIRSTFVMNPTHIANATRWIQAKCTELGRSQPVIISPYVVTCAHLWSCFLRARILNSPLTKAKRKGPMYFGFIAGGITRVPFKVPGNYFGNCVGFGRAVANREDLMEDDGILVAANAIAKTIKKLNNDVLGGAERWVSDWETIIGSDDHIHVIGSPKVNLYGIDFGWGSPKKIEEVSIDVSKGVSLTDCRDIEGGIEIGVTLPNFVMDAFSKLFCKGLSIFAICS